jgi:hypothetical protein
MNNERKQTSANEVEQMTPKEAQRLAIAIGQLEGMAPNKVLAEGWCLTRPPWPSKAWKSRTPSNF